MTFTVLGQFKTKQEDGGLIDKLSASQTRDRVLEPHTGHNHFSSYDTSTG